MSAPFLDDAFEHHAWATRLLIDACCELPEDQVNEPVPGTYGTIFSTLSHLVGGDSFYLSLLSDYANPESDPSTFEHVREQAAANAVQWAHVLARVGDPSEVVRDEDDFGYQRDASVGLRLAQALHHGNEHRAQVCTALTVVGVTPPETSVWDYGLASGRMVETQSSSHG
ncbi:MAG: DinB family protein [Acidimicrobiales bacterium]